MAEYVDKAWGAVKRLHDPRQHKDKWGDVWNQTLGDEDESAIAQRDALTSQGQAAGGFADTSQSKYAALGFDAYQQRQRMQRLANGEDSLSAEQLRQGLQQNLGTQRAQAASAAPRDQAMAARTAANNMQKLGYGYSGQQATAGIQERQAAQNALNQMIMQQRQQELQASLQSRQNAVGAYGGITPEGTWKDRWAAAIGTGIGAAMSDRRVKEDVADADEESKQILKGLKSYRYKYKDPKHGKGSQYGIMAQDLELNGLEHTIIETREGKAVDGAKLSTANTALIASLGRRMAKLEEKASK